MMRDPETIVRDFARSWEARDLEGVIAALTEDIVYENVPLPAMRGHDEVRAFVAPNLAKADGIRFEFLNVAVAPNGAVLTERIDTFFFGDKHVSVPLMGIFELRGEKIARWRDYADIGTFVRQMQEIGQAPGPGIA
jgi:limonene-1,2-epoxide hydrolase